MEKMKSKSNLLFALGMFFMAGSILTLSSLNINSCQVILFEWEILSMSGLTWSLLGYIDWVFLYFSASVLFISFVVLYYSGFYMLHAKFHLRFYMLVSLFVFSMLLMIFSPNIFSLILGWDGLGISSFLLVIYYGNSKSIAAGYITIFTNRLGDALIILSLCWAAFNSDFTHSFNYLTPNWKEMILFLLLAAMTKSAQIPFSAWLPAAMAAPTPVSSLVHSSTLVTAGVYLSIRFYNLLEMNKLLWLLSLIGVMTMVMAGITASFANDIKKIVAFSTLSQLGMMFIMVGNSLPELAFYHLLVHAFFKALLFLSVGTVMHLSESWQEMKSMSLNSLSSTILMTLTLVSNLSLMGIPFMSGYFSKDLFMEMLMSENSIFYLELSGIMFGAVLTVLYSMRMLLFVWSQYGVSSLSSSLELSSFIPYRSLFLLWGLALMGGGILGWSMPFPLMVPASSNLHKILILILVVLSMMMSVILYSWPMGKKKGLWTLSTLWGLSIFSSNIFLPKLHFSVNQINSNLENGILFNFIFNSFLKFGLTFGMRSKILSSSLNFFVLGLLSLVWISIY